MPDAGSAPATSRPWTGVAWALKRAVPVFLGARVLAVVFVPLVLAALAFLAIGGLAWTPFTAWLASAFGGSSAASTWPMVAARIVAFLIFMLGAVLTALVTIATVAMPVIVRVVAARDFADLERRHGGTLAGSLSNAAFAVAVFIPAWLLSLLLLPLPPLFVAASLLLSAWLNQRLFRYDALAEHADAKEMRDVVRSARRRLFGLGLTLAPLSYVPVVNLFAPLYAGVAFAYLCLGELAATRSAARIANQPRPA